MPQFNQYQPAQDQKYDYKQAGGGQGPSQAKRFLIFGGIIVVVIVVVMLFFSVVIGGGDSAPGQDASRVVSRQQDLLTLIETYSGSARSLDVQTKISQINAILLSDTRSLVAAGVSPSDSPVTDSSLDSSLSSAASGSNFDAVFLAALEEQLLLNTQDMESINQNVSNQNVRDALATAYSNQTKLLE